MPFGCASRLSPDSTDPCKCVVGLGAAEGTEVSSSSVGMGADSRGSADVVIDTDLLPVWSREAVTAVGYFRPGWLAISEFCCCSASITVVFADSVLRFTAKDAADRVTLSAALRKWQVVISGTLPTTRRWAKKILTGWDIFRRHQRWILLLNKQLELISRLRRLVFHDIMINSKLSRLGTIFTTQLELQVFPCIELTNLVFLCIKKIKVRGPPGGVRTRVSILILHLMEPEAVLRRFRPFTKI